MSKPIKFKEIIKLLNDLDFKPRFRGNHRIYSHEKSEALIVLPKFSPNSIVQPMHIAMIRRILKDSGMLDKEEFDSRVKEKR